MEQKISKTVKNFYEKYPVPNYKVEKIKSYKWIIEILDNDIKQDSEILDLGCGTGETSCFLSEFGKVTGVDFSEKSIKIAKKLKNKLKIKNINFVSADLKTIKFNKKFDYIFCIGVLHHISDVEKALINIREIMNKNTIFVCFVYNYYSYWRFNNNLEYPKAENENMFQDIYNHPFTKFYTEKEFKNILEKKGFEIIKFWKKIPNFLRIITGRGKMMGFACKLKEWNIK